MATDESKSSQKMIKIPKKGKFDTENTGVIYLSTIPTRMAVAYCQELFSAYGKVGRIYFKPDEEQEKMQNKTKKNMVYKEGWVEFKDKKDAKRVAKTLNCQQVGGKRRLPWYEDLWCMKYLPGFKWRDLTEHLENERAAFMVERQAAIEKAKKDREQFQANSAKSHYLAKRKAAGEEQTVQEWSFNQKKSDAEILSRKRKAEKEPSKQQQKKPKKMPKILAEDTSFLKSLFSGGKDQ